MLSLKGLGKEIDGFQIFKDAPQISNALIIKKLGEL